MRGGIFAIREIFYALLRERMQIFAVGSYLVNVKKRLVKYLYVVRTVAVAEIANARPVTSEVGAAFVKLNAEKRRPLATAMMRAVLLL